MADVSYLPGGRTAIVGDSRWVLIDASAVENTRRRVTWTTVNAGCSRPGIAKLDVMGDQTILNRGRRASRHVLKGFCATVGCAAVLAASACSSASSTALAGSSAGWTNPARAGAGSAGAAHPSASSTAAKAGASVTITAVGDTMLGNTPNLAPDPVGYFDAVRSSLTSGAQVVFANLEGTLTTAPGTKCGAGAGTTCFAFRNPPSYAQYFKQAGFTILNDANNHSFDFGAAGQQQTVQSIHAAGLAQTGLPGQIATVTANGVKVAILGFAPYNWAASLLDVTAARTLIAQAHQQAPIVVVYMHAGAEGPSADHVTGHEEIYLGEDRGNAEAFAHMAIDAGASLVIASGPHVLRGMQFYKGHLIAYSLGNFAGYGNFASGGNRDMSAILRVTLSSAGQFERARMYPVLLTGQGKPVPGGGATAFVAQLSAQDFGSGAAQISSSGVITRQ
jgi:poly-gamma-glutamate capsule biosynthesis protein CapA/YwtB (metallophosphatase superfamily)